ncbi:MAG: hypothetical protein KBA53_13635, partial [Thermoclostridium sp.]|nr:hypothetical protein [Thermoclostridium sp.]
FFSQRLKSGVVGVHQLHKKILTCQNGGRKLPNPISRQGLTELFITTEAIACNRNTDLLQRQVLL